MKNYRITVNGNTYDVQVEEVNGNTATGTSQVTVSAPKAQAPVQNAASVRTAAPAQPASSGAQGSAKVNSPMPGNILDIKVNVGDKVSANQVVVILEAMKMENEIVTPVAGTVASINVTKGQTVASGDVLVTIAE